MPDPAALADALTAAPHSPRDTHRDLARWRRRSRTVRVLRWALPLAGLALLAALGVQTAISGLARRAPRAPETATLLQMTNPRFIGRDERGRPFKIAAKSAIRDAAEPTHILLSEPDVSLGADGGVTSRATARTGVYSENDHILHLAGDVRYDDGKGARFAAPNAVADTRAGSIKGEGQVVADSPNGQLTAGSYDVRDRGDHMIFRGRVRTRINRD